MFKVMLAPNQQPDLNDLNYPLFASTKLDGIRCLFIKGEMLSRSLKQIQCKQLREKLEPLRKYSEENNVILDGEIYGHGMTFQEITHFVMTKDLEESKTVKKNGGVTAIPEELKFYCFDCVKDDNFDEPFSTRIKRISFIRDMFSDIFFEVGQNLIHSQEEINYQFENVIEQGYEGLILKSLDGRYKCGRGTLNEGLIFKVKPFLDFDAEVIGLVQSTEVNTDAEKKTNEMGRSVTSKKQNDRHVIDKASCFKVLYEGKEVKVVIALPDEDKKYIWNNPEEFIGRMIQYKGMMVGAKDLPRHPTFQRYRDDKK